MDGLYRVVREVIPPEMCAFLRDAFLLAKQGYYEEFNVPQDNLSAFSDDQCPNSCVFYSHPISESLMVHLLGLIESVTGKRLCPTYSYSRIYWNGSILGKHKDRPSCEYSMTVCLSSDPEPWPIYMEGEKVILEPGDVVIYKGCDAEHWRDPYEGKQQIQSFLHYVDLDGPHAEFAFDKRPSLGTGERGYLVNLLKSNPLQIVK